MLACEGAEAASQQSAGTHRRAGATHSRLCAAGLVIHVEVQLAKAGATLHHCRSLVGCHLQCVRLQCRVQSSTDQGKSHHLTEAGGAAGAAAGMQPALNTISQAPLPSCCCSRIRH